MSDQQCPLPGGKACETHCRTGSSEVIMMPGGEWSLLSEKASLTGSAGTAWRVTARHGTPAGCCEGASVCPRQPPAGVRFLSRLSVLRTIPTQTAVFPFTTGSCHKLREEKNKTTTKTDVQSDKLSPIRHAVCCLLPTEETKQARAPLNNTVYT